MEYQLTKFPKQKLSDRKKTEKWWKDCIDTAAELTNTDHEQVRKSFRNKIVNYNLRINKIDPKDVEEVLDPNKLGLETFPSTFRHIGMGNNKINLLIGEERKRPDEFKAVISAGDQEGISRKESDLMDTLESTVSDIIKANYQNEDQVAEKLAKLQHYTKYEYQDMSEKVANKVLKREYQRLELKGVFSECFEDALIAGEEIVYVGVEGGRPSVRKVNPLNFYTLGQGESNRVEDSDIQVEFSWMSIGQVSDIWYDQLTEAEVDKLENRDGMDKTKDKYSLTMPTFTVEDRYGYQSASGMFLLNPEGVRSFGSSFDADGNVKVARTCWKSKRKIGKLKYYDEGGNEQFEFVPEQYLPDTDAGEEIVKWIWPNEWWQGVRIADDIYVDVGPIGYSGRSMVNLSTGTPNYVGTFFNTNSGEIQSLMDILKPLDYAYNIVWWKREMDMATHYGNIMAYNTSMVPAGWTPEKWFQHVTVKRMMPLNPTAEILKGPSQGKSAGVFNTLTATNIPFDNTNSIRMWNEMLLSIEDTMGKLSGVSPQRESQIQASETVGGVERAISQSSHITEKWYGLHSYFKKRVLTKLLEVCKFVYKETPEYGQFVFDDMGMEVIKSMSEFQMSDYDIYISNSSRDFEVLNSLKQLSQAALQAGAASYSDVVSILRSDSVQDVSARLEEASKRIAREQKQQQQAQQQLEETKMQQARAMADYSHNQNKEMEGLKLQGDMLIEQLKADNKILTEKIKVQNDSNSNDINDEVEERMLDKQLKHQTAQDEKDKRHESKENTKKINADLQKARISAAKKPSTKK